MVAPENERPVRRVVRSVATTKWTSKAREVAASLKAQHAAGRDGDDSPAVPVWPTAKEQFDALRQLFKTTPKQRAIRGPSEPSDEPTDDEVREVADALRGVNWSEVRAATTERTSDVTRTMRSMAERVDWAKVQPVAAQVSSALIAAVAAGRIPIGGRLGPIVVKAITDQNNLGKRIAANLDDTPGRVPKDFGNVIEATARDV